MNEERDLESEAVEHARDLAWELYSVQPENPQIPAMAQSVLARNPRFTGMIVLQALHYQEVGEPDRARQLLQDLAGTRDHQYIGAISELRDLEYNQRNYAEALRLAELVLRESPEPEWRDVLRLGFAETYAIGAEQGWARVDSAVEMSAAKGPDQYNIGLALRASHLYSTGAPAERLLAATEPAVAATPTDTILLTALAQGYMYTYRLEEAEQILLRVLREEPTDSVAEASLGAVSAFLRGLRGGEFTIEEMKAAGMGEQVSVMWRELIFGTDIAEALAALDLVMPPDLRAALHAPIDRESAYESDGNREILSWHNGQAPGSAAFWRADGEFRLLSAAEVDGTEAAIAADPAAWPQFTSEENFELIFTNDAGSFLIVGFAGRMFRRDADGTNTQIAPALSDWFWDRVAAFGGNDARLGKS